MNQRTQIFIGVAVLLLMLTVFRFGCRSGSDLSEGDSVEARLEQIDTMRQRQSPDDVARLSELADHENRRVSTAAVHALGDFDDSASQNALADRVQDERAHVRAAAAAAMGESPEDRQHLLTVLQTDPDGEVRAGAVRGLIKAADPQNTETLPEFLKALEDPDPRVRAMALRGVYRISVQRFMFDPAASPQSQQQRLAYMKRSLRERGLLK